MNKIKIRCSTWQKFRICHILANPKNICLMDIDCPHGMRSKATLLYDDFEKYAMCRECLIKNVEWEITDEQSQA